MYNIVLSQKLTFRIIRHVSLFMSIILLFTWVTHSRSGDSVSFIKDLVMVSANALIFFGYAYLTVYIFIPCFLGKRKVVLFVVSFVLAGTALSLIKFIFSDFIFYWVISPESASPGNPVPLSSLLVNTKDMTFIVALFALAKFARDHYLLESTIRELQKKGLEAELKLLEHQMDPHVIFNNFNNLYSISINRPEYLKSTVKKLKSILHYLFNESKSDKVLLAKEVEMIENYIGLERLRYGDRLNISFKTEGHINGYRIAPLILYSFVENCFVHGAGEDPYNSSINIEVRVKDSRLCFTAANSVTEKPPGQKNNGKLSANENSLRRLELQYPNSHRLTIREKRNEYVVELYLSL